LFLFALWHYLRQPNLKRLLLCGAALGAVLSTKFSAVLLLPVAGLLVLAAVWRPQSDSAKTGRIKAGPNDPCPCGSGKKFKKCHGESGKAAAADSEFTQKLTRAIFILGVMVLVAVFVVEALYFFPSDPALYLKGMGLVNADHAQGYTVFMAGQMERRFLT